LHPLIEGYVELGDLDAALSCFDEMKILGIPRERQIYSILIKASIANERPETADALEREMEIYGSR